MVTVLLIDLVVAKNVTYRKFNSFSRERFCNDIASQRWDDLLRFVDPNDMWLAWKTLFLDVVDNQAPPQTKGIRSLKCPWVTPQLKRRMHERDKLKRTAIVTNDPCGWVNFKKFRNQINNEIRNANGMFYNFAFRDSRGNLLPRIPAICPRKK